MLKSFQSMLLVAMFFCCLCAPVYAEYGDSFDYLSHVNEDIPTDTPAGMVDCNIAGSRFSAVPVDKDYIGIMHSTSRNMWETVPVKLPRAVFGYKLLLWQNILYVYGGLLDDTVLNLDIFRVQVCDGQDELALVNAGRLPAASSDCDLTIDAAGKVLLTLYSQGSVLQYRGDLNINYDLRNWVKN